MSILSIDVGMKHLAYCVIKTNSKENYEILDLSIINLCTDKVTPKCVINTSKKYAIRNLNITKTITIIVNYMPKKQNF